MLKYDDFVENFSDVFQVENGIIICEDVMPRETTRYYFKLANEETGGYDSMAICEGESDVESARLVLCSAMPVKDGAQLSMRSLAANKYGFTDLLLAPKDYHGYLKACPYTQVQSADRPS